MLTRYLKTQNSLLNQNIKYRDIRRENHDANKILRDLRTLYEQEEDYYKPIRTGITFSSNCIEYESNGDKDKTLSISTLMKLHHIHMI